MASPMPLLQKRHASGQAIRHLSIEGFAKSMGPSLAPRFLFSFRPWISHFPISLCSASGSRSNVDFLSTSRSESVHLWSWSWSQMPSNKELIHQLNPGWSCERRPQGQATQGVEWGGTFLDPPRRFILTEMV